MSARVVALYKAPKDAAAFDKYYFGNHVPLARTLPRLQKYEVNAGPVTDMTGASPYYLAAILSFDSLADVQAAMTSKEGIATAADLGNFAGAGVGLLIFEVKEV